MVSHAVPTAKPVALIAPVKAPGAAYSGGTTLLDRLLTQPDGIRTAPSYPLTGVWGVLLGQPHLNAAGSGLMIDKIGQAVVYPTTDLIGKSVGTIDFSATGGADDDVDHVLLDSWPTNGNGRIRVVYHRGKIALTLTSDAGVDSLVTGPLTLASGSTARIAVLYDADDLTLTVNGSKIGSIANPALPSAGTLALVIGNDRALQAPSKFAFSGLRLATDKSAVARSVPASSASGDAQIDLSLGYERRLYPVIDKLKASSPGVAAYVSAVAYNDIQDYARALTAITPLATAPSDPLYVPAVMLQASILRGQKDYGGAFDKLSLLAVSRDPGVSIRAQLAQASLLHEQGSVDEAKRIISDIIARYHDQPELAAAYLMIADDLALRGDWQGVLTSTQQITGGGSELTVPIGQPLEIRIADSDLAARASDAGLPVTVTSSNGDKESLVLRPAFSKGVYYGHIDTALGEAKVGDGTLEVFGGGKITIDYIDHIANDGVDVPRRITVGLATDAKVSLMAQAAVKVFNEVSEYQKQNILDDNWTLIGDLPTTASDFFRDPDDGSLKKRGTKFDKTFLNNIRPGQSVYVELDEPDVDTSSAPDKATLDVRTSSGHKVSVPLIETGPHTGVFSGTVKTMLGGQAADGTLPVTMNDVITARYAAARPIPVRAGRIPTPDPQVHVATTAGVLTVGVMLASADPGGDKQFVHMWRISRDTPVVIQVEDRDLDVSDMPDTATVHVHSSGGADADIKLNETGPHTGLFTGNVVLGSATFKAAPGDVVTVTYHDAENPTGKEADVISSFKVNIAENAAMALERQVYEKPKKTASANTSPAPEAAPTWAATTALVPGSVYRMTLVDPDMLPSTAGEFTRHMVLKASNGSAVDVPLKATADEANQRNVFQGQFFCRLGDSTAALKAYFSQTGAPVQITEDTDLYTLASMPALNVLGNSTVTANYTEPLTAEGKANVPRAWPLRVAFDATLTALDDRDVELDTIKPGMPFTLQIEDATGDKTAKRDTIAAKVTSSTGAILPVTLTETDTHSGMFTADVPTNYGTAAKVPGALNVSFGGKLTVSYLNASTESGAPATRLLELPVNPLGEASALMLSKVFDDPKFEAETLVRLGESLYAVGAAKLVTTASAMSPVVKGARTNAELQQAGKLLDQVVTRFPSSEYVVESLYLTGKIRREEQRFDEAKALFDRVVNDYPDSEFVAQALYQIVQLQYDRGDIAAAVEAAMRLAYGFPSDPIVTDAFLKVGEYYYTTKQYAKAAFVYKRIVDRFPDNPKVPLITYRMATAYYKAGLLDDDAMMAKAVKSYLDFATQYKDNEYADAAMYWAAIASEKRMDVRKAYTILTRMLITYPSGDMKSYAVRERDKIKEQNPDIRADDEL